MRTVSLPALALSMALSLAGCATAPKPPAAPAIETGLTVRATANPGQAAAVETRTLTAAVKAVDLAARTITVAAAGGEPEVIKVGPSVQRLAELAAGDTITLEVEQGLLLEYQPVGAEAVAPRTVVAGASAGSDLPPGAVLAAGIQATVTVLSVDLPARAMIFVGPSGYRYRVKAGPKVALEKLQPGDRLVATYVEAVAIRVDRGGAAL